MRARSASPVPGSPALITVEDHDQDEVDLLEVLDQRVSTTAALNNITSAFWPSRFTSPPVVELDEPAADLATLVEDESADSTPKTAEQRTTEELELELMKLEEENDPLAAHLALVLKKQKRSEKTRAGLLGVWTFLKTPLGVAAAICQSAWALWLEGG